MIRLAESVASSLGCYAGAVSSDDQWEMINAVATAAVISYMARHDLALDIRWQTAVFKYGNGDGSIKVEVSSGRNRALIELGDWEFLLWLSVERHPDERSRSISN